MLGCAAAFVVGLLVVGVAVVLGELALTLVGVPVSAAVPVTLLRPAGSLEQLAGAACPSEDGGGACLKQPMQRMRWVETGLPEGEVPTGTL